MRKGGAAVRRVCGVDARLARALIGRVAGAATACIGVFVGPVLGHRHILAAVVVVVALVAIPFPFPLSLPLMLPFSSPISFSLFSPAVCSFPFPFSIVPRNILRHVATLMGLITRPPASMVLTAKTAAAQASATASATATAAVFMASSPAFALRVLGR